MPKRPRQETFYGRTSDVKNEKLNIALRSQEKVFDDFEVVNYRVMPAPTTNPERPRARKLAYSRESQTLVIKFRDGSWIGYDDIPVEFWNDLKASDSTGKYLAASGIDNMPWYPFDPNQMTPEVRVLFNS